MMSYDEMVAQRKALREKDKAGTLTKEEADSLDWLEQKLDDWATDYEVRE
jgi:hypothetical protein